MGGKESREPIVKYGIHKHYVDDDVYLEPIGGPDGQILNPRYATIIFLHGQGENPQMYIEKFFNSCGSRITPWDKSVHVILMQAPNVVSEDKDKGKSCEWLKDGEDMLSSGTLTRVNEMIGK